MSTLTTRRLAASGMAGAALLAIAGFTALGSIFDYPKILKEPTDHILEAFRENQSAVTGWFLVLVISAALLAPVGVLLGRDRRRNARPLDRGGGHRGGDRAGDRSVPVGPADPRRQ